MRKRAELIDELKKNPSMPVLIVGGGINGVGLLRDLAAQGIAAVLTERGDICSGTSAAPSRLIHGGLRYLETGEFELVRESVRERELLLRNAPHLVRPIPTWVPLTSWTAGSFLALGRFLRLVRTPGRKGALPLKIGLSIYDKFAGQDRGMPVHRFFGANTARQILPKLSRRICVVAEYYDARIVHPERLTLELVADAERDCPQSMAIPYLSAKAIEDDHFVLKDQCSDEVIRVRPQLIVNAAGAWADQVDEGLGVEDKLIGGTKGSHLVLRAPELAGQLGERMLYFETPDHRICLIYALDPQHVLLGTTDLATDNPDDRICSRAEIEYLLQVLSDVLPGHGLIATNIVFTYAGVRPLPRTNEEVTGAISRDHKLYRFFLDSARYIPIFTLVGGKWTTYRTCAQEITNAVLAELALPRLKDTMNIQIGGGRNWPKAGAAVLSHDLVMTTGIEPHRAEILVRRYGTSAGSILSEIMAYSSDQALSAAKDYSTGEITYLAKQERVTRLEDLILRRTLMAFEGLASRSCITEVASIAAAALGWDAEQTIKEIDATVRLLEFYHSVPDINSAERFSQFQS